MEICFAFQLLLAFLTLLVCAAAVPYPFASPRKDCRLERSTTDKGQCFLEPECEKKCT